MALSSAAVARVHEVFGLFFLLVLTDELRRLARGDHRPTGPVLPATFVVAGVGMWAATVFATDAAEYVVHSVWADLLLVMGGVEWARRSGRLRSRVAPYAVPVGIAVGGALFFTHLHSSVFTSMSARWHAMMGAALVAGGILAVLVEAAGSRGLARYLPELPLAGFVVLLLTYPS
ncbi:MAG TPA: hypothetical protein VE777_01430 [Gaiellales bacterium]|jgi:hypothetical protein|nr:hypothetical protein [Gaiellales bacterium]